GALGDHWRGGVIDGDRLGAGGAVAAGIGGGVNAGDSDLAAATAWGALSLHDALPICAAAVVGGQHRGVIGGGHLGGALDGAVGGALEGHRLSGSIVEDPQGAGGAVAAGIGGGVNAGDSELAGATAWGEHVGAVRDGDRAAAVVGGQDCGVVSGGHLGGALDGAVGGALGDHRGGGVIDGDRLGAGGAVAAG